MTRDEIHAELDRTRVDFRHLVDTAGRQELRAPSDGTKWTNEQLLFHMLFGYLVTRALLGLVRGFSRLPDRVSATFAAVLNAGTRPFDVVNYLGGVGGARVLGGRRMCRALERVTRALDASLDREPEEGLSRWMHFPTRWDPYFKDVMTLRDVYHFPTQHYDHHRRQLTLSGARTSEGPG